MSNIKAILVSTDLSARSDRAFDRARALAREAGALLHVLHVLESKDGTAPTDLAAAAHQQISDDLDGEEGNIIVEYGSVPNTIARIAKETGSDLIVTGTARWNGINDFVLGTAVDHIVRHAAVPVLVVKNRPHAPYRRILIASDFSDCSRAALVQASRLFPDAVLHLVHAFHVPYEGWLDTPEAREEWRQTKQRELDDFLAHPELHDSERLHAQTTLAYGDTQAEIHQYAEQLGADLIVLGTRGRGGLARAMLGSTASDLLTSAPVDTLMVQA